MFDDDDDDVWCESNSGRVLLVWFIKVSPCRVREEQRSNKSARIGKRAPGVNERGGKETRLKKRRVVCVGPWKYRHPLPSREREKSTDRHSIFCLITNQTNMRRQDQSSLSPPPLCLCEPTLCNTSIVAPSPQHVHFSSSSPLFGAVSLNEGMSKQSLGNIDVKWVLLVSGVVA